MKAPIGELVLFRKPKVRLDVLTPPQPRFLEIEDRIKSGRHPATFPGADIGWRDQKKWLQINAAAFDFQVTPDDLPAFATAIRNTNDEKNRGELGCLQRPPIDGIIGRIVVGQRDLTPTLPDSHQIPLGWLHHDFVGRWFRKLIHNALDAAIRLRV